MKNFIAVYKEILKKTWPYLVVTAIFTGICGAYASAQLAKAENIVRHIKSTSIH
jgi:hypothetical protein